MHHADPDRQCEDEYGGDKMTAQHVMTSRPGTSARRHVRPEKSIEPQVLKMSARTRKHSPEESPASQLLAEALAALVLLLAMFFVLLAPE
jgi:hypothetical protein